MAVRPIIFSAPMVRALLDGRKTMTRRVMKEPIGLWENDASGRLIPIPRPYVPGDLLWVREAWAPEQYDPSLNTVHATTASTKRPAYRASWDAEPAYKWRSPIHMPRIASRLTIEVTGVKVERLQCISEADAVSEGVQQRHGPDAEQFSMDGEYWWGSGPRGAFLEFWRHLHHDNSWDANPWVVAIIFKVHKANVDALANPASGEG